MPWPLSAVNSGPRRLSQAHGITETCRNSQPTCSAASCSSPADRPDVQSQAQRSAPQTDRPSLRASNPLQENRSSEHDDEASPAGVGLDDIVVCGSQRNASADGAAKPPHLTFGEEKRSAMLPFLTEDQVRAVLRMEDLIPAMERAL